MVDFGSKLKTLRKKSGMTQTDLARRLNITKSVVSYYENQERVPSPDVLVRLADIFNVSTDYLLGRNNENKTIDVSGLDDEEIKVLQMTAELLRKRNNK